MAVVQHRAPVVVRHPLTDQYIGVHRGMELADDDPLVQAHPWLFDADDTPREVTSTPVEAATAAPGEKRSTRRA